MQLFNELNEENFILFGARNYYNPTCIDAEEFYNDVKRFNYLKRLINRYNQSGILSERLMLNHLIIIFNVFGAQPGLKMLEYKVGEANWHIIKPFLIFLRIIENHEYSDISMDEEVVSALRKI